MNADKDNIKQAMHNEEVISKAVTEQINLHEKLKAERKSPEYILAHGQGYAEGVYDTKTELQPKISDLKEELETKDKMIDLILGDYVDNRYSFKFIEPNKLENKRKELINEYKEHYRKKVQK